MLTLPVAGIIKKHFPDVYIAFLGKAYTKPVIETCKYVDCFIDENDFLNHDVQLQNKSPECIIHVLPVKKIAERAKQLKIPFRIGTTNRLYHLYTCNELVRLSRKNSHLHEAQLNLKLLKPFGIDKIFSFEEIYAAYGFEKLHPLQKEFEALIDKSKYNLILHPKSQGSAREWGLNNFVELIRLIDADRYKIFISGTKKERELLQPLFDAAGELVTDITGTMNLDQFISFIEACDGLVANSTGPLHIAAALGKDALGIYPPIRPMHQGRWAPIGPKAKVFVVDRNCSDCRNNTNACHCIREIQPFSIKAVLDKASLHLNEPVAE